MKNIEQQFLNFIKNINFSDKKVAIGFSGGADSCALLDLCIRFLPKRAFSVVHFSHGDNPLMTPGEVAPDFCAQRCSYYNLNLIVVPLSLEKGKVGWEAAGHKARKDYAMNYYDMFFLGHHLDDQCENYFIQTLRGSGAAKSIKSEEIMIRPLLGVAKTEIIEYLNNKKLDWVEDKTNENNLLTRNFWRNKVLPQIEEYYPDYRKRVLQASSVDENLMALALDIAKLDGLEEFARSSKIELDLSLPPRRIVNLFYYYCRNSNISCARPAIEELVNQILRPQKIISTTLFGHVVQSVKENKKIIINIYIKPKAEIVGINDLSEQVQGIRKNSI